jgi:hypothetical protein
MVVCATNVKKIVNVDTVTVVLKKFLAADVLRVENNLVEEKKNKRLSPKKASLSDIKKLAKKYSVTDNGSRAHISAVLCSARSSYLSKKERKMILPFLKNSKNKTILLQMINTNEPQKKLPQ